MLYGDGKTFQPEEATALLITDKQHQMPTELADHETRQLTLEHPLPPQAARGGDFKADPSSREQQALTKGTLQSRRARLQICSLLPLQLHLFAYYWQQKPQSAMCLLRCRVRRARCVFCAAQCAERYKKWLKGDNEIHKELGCRGASALQLQLSWFRYEVYLLCNALSALQHVL